jgi:hypothetical protein
MGMVSGQESIDSTLQALSRQPFRARFHLRGREAATVELRGMEALREHAGELLADRVAPAAPRKDGKQTPYRGHPVFVASTPPPPAAAAASSAGTGYRRAGS